MTALASEHDLTALARAFADAEARVRALVAQAPDGDRRELLREALLILTELRRRLDDATIGVEVAYALAVGAVQQLQGRNIELPDPAPVTTIGGGLAKTLHDAVQTAQEGSRRAFRSVTPENVEDMAQRAVTAHVARNGARLALAGYADMQAATVGRRSTSIGTRDALGPTALVTISSHGTENPICRPLEGQTYRADGDLPPFHASCAHVASPAGFSTSEHIAALENVRGEHLRRWYVERYERRRTAP